MRFTLPFLYEDDTPRFGAVCRNSRRGSVEVEIPEVGSDQVQLALFRLVGESVFDRFIVAGSLASRLAWSDGRPIRPNALQEAIDRVLIERHKKIPIPDFPAAPYLRAPRWDRLTALTSLQPGSAPPLPSEEGRHDERRRQAKAFYERSLFVIKDRVWAAVRDPMLSLKLWRERAGVTFTPRPLVGGAYRRFSLTRAAELTEFVRGTLGRRCGPLPTVHIADSSAFAQCDLVELAWDTLRIWGHPELDSATLLGGPPNPGTVEAKILVRTAHKRLAAALEAKGRQDRHRLTTKFVQRWEFELTFPLAQEAMTGDLVPSWTADEVPQHILDELATLSL